MTSSKISIVVFALLSLCFFSCSPKYAKVTNTEKDYPIIPKPTSLSIQQGRFEVNKNTQISYTGALQNEAQYLSEMLSLASGQKIIAGSNLPKATILLQLDPQIPQEEGYFLDVKPQQISIKAKKAIGIFYGIQSLRQLLPAETEAGKAAANVVSIPAVSVQDNPLYAYRGLHLDVSRHFFPVSFVKKYIDLIAMHKMNTFHWHLTDDQGWRIEIKKYPKLTAVGGYRNGTIVGKFPGSTNDQQQHGGFYTQEEVKEVVRYAATKHVTVIPEIELPGHAGAAIASYPQLSCFPQEPTVIKGDMMSEKGKELQKSGTPKIVYETWGVIPDVFCAGKEETFSFLEDVLAEVLPLFPSTFIHIGGDECPKGNWQRCENCQKRIKALGLKDEHELQSYFIQRMEKFVNAKGKQIIGWDEILEGGLAPNATVMSWRGIKGGISAAQQNHNVIMTPNTHCYFDYYQSQDKDKEPLAIGGFLPVEKVYSYNPRPVELTKEQQAYIIGAQANLWTEYIGSTQQIEYMVLPRMTALSEVLWCKPEDKNWDNFQGRLQQMVKRFDALQLNYAKHSLNK